MEYPAETNRMSAKLDSYDLIEAAKVGDLETIECAIASGLEIDFCDEESADQDYQSIPGRTALMWATISGQIEAAQMLLEAGASPLVEEKRAFHAGENAWELAARHDRPDVLSMFEEHSPNPEQLARALAIACGEGNIKTVRRLLDSGVNVDSRNSQHFTSLMAAAIRGQAEVVELLLNRGADISLRDKGKFAGTAIHKAITALQTGVEHSYLKDGEWVTKDKGKPVECVRLLLKFGADPNDVRSDGNFPIISAAGEAEVVRLLIDAGAEVNKEERDGGGTALHWAVLYENIEAVGLLLDAKADVSPVDEKGRTPLDIARDRNMAQIAELLESAGGVSGMETDEGRAAVDAAFAEELSAKKRREKALAAGDALRRDFSIEMESQDYKLAISRLESLTESRHKLSENTVALAYSIVPKGEAEGFVEDEHESFTKIGCTLFYMSNSLDKDEMLCLLPSTNPLEIIASIGTAGPNYDVYTSDIITELSKLYEIAPFRLTELRYDKIGLQFSKPLSKARADTWGRRLYALCPDLVEQGFLTMKNLREHLSTNTKLVLWWD